MSTESRKAVYFDQTVRALKEMIANERRWLESTARTALEQCQNDVLYPYCSNSFHEGHRRAVRLAELSSVLSLMTRNVEDRDNGSDRNGEDSATG